MKRREPEWRYRMLFGACLLVPATVAALYLVDTKPDTEAYVYALRNNPPDYCEIARALRWRDSMTRGHCK